MKSPRWLIECSRSMVASLFSSGNSKEQGRNHLAFYDRASEITHCHFCNVMLVTPVQFGMGLHKNVNIRDTGHWGHLGGWVSGCPCGQPSSDRGCTQRVNVQTPNSRVHSAWFLRGSPERLSEPQLARTAIISSAHPSLTSLS